MKNKQRVRPWSKEDEGKYTLFFVRYKRKKWQVKDLLEHLAQRIEELEENQCEPGAQCLFLMEDALLKKCRAAMEYIDADSAIEGCFRGIGDEDTE